jgi:argininosuccinate lyase
LVDQAERHAETLLPGYTHLRRAQPITFAHFLLSFFWMFQRDRERLRELRPRIAVLPLGSGALAGNPFDIDRKFLARELGFESISENSLDAVSDRDYAVEFLAIASLLQIHLSRLAEDLILYSSDEFGYVQIDDAYSSGSSLMPQKKNPDSLELIRGKTGRVVGDLNSLLVTLKGLPSTYDKDLQEDKEPLFDAIDTLEMTLPVAAGVLRTLEVNADRMNQSLDLSLLATDLADYLVANGTPFRDAHAKVGAMVKRAQTAGVSIDSVAAEELGQQVSKVFNYRNSVERRNSYGGTAPEAVRSQLEHAKRLLEAG